MCIKGPLLEDEHMSCLTAVPGCISMNAASCPQDRHRFSAPSMTIFKKKCAHAARAWTESVARSQFDRQSLAEVKLVVRRSATKS